MVERADPDLGKQHGRACFALRENEAFALLTKALVDVTVSLECCRGVCDQRSSKAGACDENFLSDQTRTLD